MSVLCINNCDKFCLREINSLKVYILPKLKIDLVNNPVIDFNSIYEIKFYLIFFPLETSKLEKNTKKSIGETLMFSDAPVVKILPLFFRPSICKLLHVHIYMRGVQHTCVYGYFVLV